MKYELIDSHTHFWDIDRFCYFWMGAHVDALRRNYLPEDLKPVVDRNGFNRIVLVQAAHSMEESRWLLRLAKSNDFIAGVVAWADLASPELGRALDELQTHTKFKGVRHLMEEEPDDAWMVRPDVLAGFAELERRDIAYDLLVRPRHLKYIAEVRACCPRLRLVVDHIAKPSIAQKLFEDWKREIQIVGALPNLWCKLSGLVTQADHDKWTARDLKPYVEYIIKCFGNDRLMFGSDWPVCTLAGSYEQVVDALSCVLESAGAADQAKIWGQNAHNFYRLD